MTAIDPRATEIVALEKAIKIFDRYAGELGFGWFLGGDPNRFYPDHDLSTPDEVATWVAACERWAAGDRTPLPHHSAIFGVGSYTYQTAEDAAVLAALHGLLARLKAETEVLA